MFENSNIPDLTVFAVQFAKRLMDHRVGDPTGQLRFSQLAKIRIGLQRQIEIRSADTLLVEVLIQQRFVIIRRCIGEEQCQREGAFVANILGRNMQFMYADLFPSQIELDDVEQHRQPVRFQQR